jgi:hypothetical protein
MESRQEEMKYMIRLKRHGPKHRTAPIKQLDPGVGKDMRTSPTTK